MYRTRIDDLPRQGLSRIFVGAERGAVGLSAYLVEADAGQGPGSHTHPYDEVAFVLRGRARWTVGGRELEAQQGDILVVKAGEVHAFQAEGAEGLLQLDLHLAPRFAQTDLDETSAVPPAPHVVALSGPTTVTGWLAALARTSIR